MSASSCSLWEEMSPGTRKLARSIIRHNPAGFAGAQGGSGGDANNNDNTTTTAAAILEERDEIPIGMHPRVAISRAITLMESKHPFKKKQGDLLLTYLLSLSVSPPPTNSDTPHDDDDEYDDEHGAFAPAGSQTFRVGFAGPPGAGKSTIIEAFGTKLLGDLPESKLAVVCIDPSSNLSGGSILGDKTRMTQLSREVDRALVRPSCNSGVLGGLSAYTDDVVKLIGCAGYPLVLVETVGLGQSEIEVAQSVDVLVLLVPPSGGDELQGVKKGIVEMANILAVTKSDGDLEAAANRTAADYKGALNVLHQTSASRSDNGCAGDDAANNLWTPPVVKTSSFTGDGLDDLWRAILRYRKHLLDTGQWDDQRRNQSSYWMWKQFNRMMQARLQEDPDLRERAKQLEHEMLDGLLTPRVAAQRLLDDVFDFTKQER